MDYTTNTPRIHASPNQNSLGRVEIEYGGWSILHGIDFEITTNALAIGGSSSNTDGVWVQSEKNQWIVGKKIKHRGCKVWSDSDNSAN